jgi:hypothetical protein
MLYDVRKTNWTCAEKLRASMNTEEYEEPVESANQEVSHSQLSQKK